MRKTAMKSLVKCPGKLNAAFRDVVPLSRSRSWFIAGTLPRPTYGCPRVALPGLDNTLGAVWLAGTCVHWYRLLEL
jgi:hypothetical protein